MPKIFTTLDKIRPAYDMTYKVVMVLCKLLLIADIAITSYAVLGRYCQQLANDYPDILGWLGVIKDPAWTEQIVLTCMSYMAVLSAALAIRTGAHIRMTAFDRYLPKNVVKVLNIVADAGVMVLAIIMLVVGWEYASTLGSKGFYESIPWLSRFWMYFPVPLAGIAMIVFELEAIYNHVKSFFVEEDEKEAAA